MLFGPGVIVVEAAKIIIAKYNSIILNTLCCLIPSLRGKVQLFKKDE